MERANANTWSSPMLAGFSGEVGARLTSEPERLELEAGEWLFREGDQADSAYLIRSGRVEIVAEHPTEVVLRQVKRGALVGELALLMHGIRSSSARACRDTELTRLTREQFEELRCRGRGARLQIAGRENAPEHRHEVRSEQHRPAQALLHLGGVPMVE